MSIEMQLLGATFHRAMIVIAERLPLVNAPVNAPATNSGFITVANSLPDGIHWMLGRVAMRSN